MPTVEVLNTYKWDSLHFMYKVKLATLANKTYYDCNPSLKGNILTKKTSPMHHLRTMNAVIVPHFNTYFIRKFYSIHSIYCSIFPDLAKTSNVKNYTRMASKSNNLDFQKESPKTMPHNFLHYDDFNVPFYSKSFS